MSVGTHTVTLQPLSGGAAVDLSCLVDSLNINHGRADADSQPEASSCTLDLSPSTDVTQPELASVEVGATLTVATTVAGTSHTRFVGTVTDISYGWDDAGAQTPDRPLGQVVATGVLADLGRRQVGAEPFPQQLDGARVAAVMAAAGITLDPAFSDPGTVQILPRDIDSQPALAVAQGTADSAGGLVWQTKDGLVRYADAVHRRGTVPALRLDACDILVTPTWRRTTEGLINEVVITYGVAAEDEEGGSQERPTYAADRPESKARYGRYDLSADTELADAVDAQRLGDSVLAANSTPTWVMGALPVDVKGLSDTDTQALLGMDMHSLLELGGLPSVGTAPTAAALWVEGFTETLAWGTHELELVVTGYCRTVPPPRWDDLAPATTWDTVQGTWDEASCLGPPLQLGRWDDVPANTRWDQIPATTTWDTWKG